MHDPRENKRAEFNVGLRAGIPIGIGYFAVSFSLGIIARDCGFNAFQGFLTSLTSYASAGQYIGFTMYGAGATLWQLVIMMIITNARYLLMGVALNQKVKEGTPLLHRILIGHSITDEIFGVSIARPGYASPYFGVGCWLSAMSMWSVGNAIGIAVGNILPPRAVSALSVALFGMFLAVIIPPIKKDKIIGCAVAISFALSYLATTLPALQNISSGNRTILLTVIIASAFALIAPRKNESPEVTVDAPAGAGETADDTDGIADGAGETADGAHGALTGAHETIISADGTVTGAHTEYNTPEGGSKDEG